MKYEVMQGFFASFCPIAITHFSWYNREVKSSLKIKLELITVLKDKI